MFLTYLRRELRRRARQAILIALGLAVGVGLVITVTAASSGVKNAQADVLHSLYGVGTDVTVTKTAPAGTGGFGGFRFGFGGTTSGSRPRAGTTVKSSRLSTGEYAPISAADVSSISHLKGVAGAAGTLILSDSALSFTVPSSSGGGGLPGGGTSGAGRGNFKPPVFFSVAGVDLSTGGLGPLSAGKITSGRTLGAADSSSDVALVDSSYARQSKLAVGSKVTIGNSKGTGTSFSVVGIVSTPSGTGSNVYIPLARAQALAGEAGQVNTIYVAASSAAQISGVQKEISAMLPATTVTTPSSLAGEVTGSLSNAATLASTLGRWLAIAVLIAAFALAALLITSAVSRRVREFGTLKALGWRSKRVVGQVMGEAVVIGIAGGIAGVGLGYLGSALVGAFSPQLTASLPATGSATPGGSRVFNPGGGSLPGGGGATGGAGFRGSGTGGRPRGFSLAQLGSGHPIAVHLTASVTWSVIGGALLLAIAGGLIAGGFGSWRAAGLRPAAALARVA
jgi:putative ABC transport system permease protein